MDETNEEKLLARLYLNLKGAKKKQDNWVDIAEDCKQLRDYYGSAKKVADKVGVSYELIRALLKLPPLPEEVKTLIKDEKILFDVAQRIARIRDKEKQVEVAQAVAGLRAHDARDVLQYAKKYPKEPLDDFRKRVTEGKDKIEKVHLAMLPLKEEIYSLLKTESQKKKISVEKLILLIVDQWAMTNGQVKVK
jgi:hypothetical protein